MEYVWLAVFDLVMLYGSVALKIFGLRGLDMVKVA